MRQRDNPEATMDCCRAGQTLMLAAYARGRALLSARRCRGCAAPARPGTVLPAGFDVRVVMILG
jgi:hypothetical protein